MVNVLDTRKRHRRPFTIAALVFALAAGTTGPSAQQQQQQAEPPRFDSSTGVSIVSVDVVVRDSLGNVVRGLTAKDFIVSEDGKPQKIETFSFQEIATDAAPATSNVQLLDGLEDKVRAEAAKAVSATATPAVTDRPADTPTINNRRMVTVLLDVSSMQPDDVQRAVVDTRK